MATERRPPRVELYSRAAMPGTHDRQVRVLDCLEDLSSTDALAGYDVHTWEGRVRVRSSTDEDILPLRRFRAFRQWADDTDASLEPFFDRTTRRSSFTGESFEEVTFPVLCLAVVDDGSIRTVAPHRRDGTAYSVEDCLEDLGATDASPPDRTSATVPAEE